MAADAAQKSSPGTNEERATGPSHSQTRPAISGRSTRQRQVTHGSCPGLAVPSLMLLAHSDAAGARSRRRACSKA